MSKSINPIDEINTNTSLTTTFFLKRFMFRYLAGKSAQPESHLISPRRLALASSGVPSQDRDAITLSHQIDHYSKAYSFLAACEEITIEDLCQVNKIIDCENNNSGQVRDNKNCFNIKGGLLAQAKYAPPSQDKIKPMLDDLIKYINQKSIGIFKKADYAHSMFVIIHPFSDANELTARILWQVLNDREKKQAVPPFIYPLHSSTNDYANSLAAFSLDKPAGMKHSFWLDSNHWCSHTEESCRKLVNETKIRINAKARRSPLSPLSQKILSLAWHHPVIYLPHFHQKISADHKSILIALEELIKINLFSTQKLKHPADAVVFECSDIIDCMKKIEDKIYYKKPTKLTVITTANVGQ